MFGLSDRVSKCAHWMPQLLLQHSTALSYLLLYLGRIRQVPQDGMTHGMGPKRHYAALLHLTYLRPRQRQRPLLLPHRGKDPQCPTNVRKEGFTLCNRLGMTCSGINYLCQCSSFLWLSQVISVPFNRYHIHLSIAYKSFTFSPPERFTTLDVTWNEKDSERNLQLTCKRKAMRIVIVVAIVKCQR